MAKDLAYVEGFRRNTAKDVVITEKKEHGRDKKRNLQITAGHSAWWNQILGIHFPLWRSGRALDRQGRDEDHQGLIHALECTHFTLSLQ